MPYIKEDRRAILEEALVDLIGSMKKLSNGVAKGDLTYLTYVLAKVFIDLNGHNYQTISDAKAALRDSADEIHDRILRLHENGAILKNGDIY